VPIRSRLLLALLLGAAVAYLVAFIAVIMTGREDQRESAGAIVVLGAAQYNGRPSPVLKARLDHALDLFQAGLAPTVVVTGGIGTGDRISEATVGQVYLVSHGIHSSSVVVLPQGRSTRESIASLAGWAREHEVERVLLVSDRFHMLRLRLEASRAGLTPRTSPAPNSPISASWRQELPFLLAEAWKTPVVFIRFW